MPMNKPLEYDFNKKMRVAEGVASTRDVQQLLLVAIPGALQAIQSHSINDRKGCDYWIEHASGKWLSVDCKIRDKDFREVTGEDDVALETWSVVEKRVPGWTLRKDKNTDYVLWFWRDSLRWCLVPFLPLCRVFEINASAWCGKYKTRQQFTPRHNGSGGYHSECVFVPRKAVWAEIYRYYSGQYGGSIQWPIDLPNPVLPAQQHTLPL